MDAARKWILAFILVMIVLPGFGREAETKIPWSPDEIIILRSLWIGSLAKLPPDPSNAVGDDRRAAQFGHRLFFDTRLSADGQVACATCHLPALAFTDGRKLGRGVGIAGRNTMTIIGTAYSPWFFWDGRKDSQWAQALGPMESAVEHGGTRNQYAHLIVADTTYRTAYKTLFGALPDLSDRKRFPPTAGPVDDSKLRAAWEQMSPSDRETISRLYSNLGKAIAAYERLLLPGPSRFDNYVKAILASNSARAKDLFSANEEAGLRLFIGRGQCTRCHNGPLFTNNVFHNTGLSDPVGRSPDRGRLIGVKQVVKDEFNCLTRYSHATANACDELRFIKTSDPNFDHGFKTPTLRNVSRTGPYMHDGRFMTLNAVLGHYNQAPSQTATRTELTPLGFSELELAQIEKFLRSLDSPPAVSYRWLEPPR